MDNDSKNNGTTRHHYTESGLENVWIEGGFKVIESPYGPGVEIEDMDGLHKCIGKMLVEKSGPLTGAEFRFLRTELDLSQMTMGLLCGREERTVRGWEARTDGVEEPANTIIRVVYQQRFDPSVSFEGMAQKIRDLQAADKKLHEMQLLNTADGWKAVA